MTGGTESLSTYVVEGLDSAPDALMKLFDGGNTGKMMVRL
jgi:NADPH-dependent curcumin reductase CurA